MCLACYLWKTDHQICSALVLLAFILSSGAVYLSNKQPLLNVHQEGVDDINNEIEDIQSVILTNQQQRGDDESRKEETKDED